MPALQTPTRCPRCLLPWSASATSTTDGACSWCTAGYPGYQPLGEEALLRALADNRTPDAPADVLVGVSGGKDSSFVLLKLARDYGLRAEAFTYVHAGSSAQSQRNAEGLCRELQVPHHVLSLPGDLHRRLFRDFFAAWVRRPDPYTAAMTCVGCKHLHYLGAQLAQARGIPLMVWATCPLEVPTFIPTRGAGEGSADRAGLATLAGTFLGKMCTVRGFGVNVLRHLPACFVGTLSYLPTSGFLRRRFPRVRHLQFFDYYPWDANAMRTELCARTGWGAANATLDWHEDCRFHAYKEYMFQAMYGVSYIDSYVSNQVRYGSLPAADGLAQLRESKAHFRAAVLANLPLLGLEALRDRIDPAVFDGFDG